MILTMTVAHIFTVKFLSLFLFSFFLQLTDINEYVLMNKYMPILLRLACFLLCVLTRFEPADGSNDPVK